MAPVALASKPKEKKRSKNWSNEKITPRERSSPEELFNDFRPLAISMAKRSFLAEPELFSNIGFGKHDLIQEMLIALNKAAKDYDASRNVSFSVFAKTVIKNRLRQLYAKTMTESRNRKPVSLHAPSADFQDKSERRYATIADKRQLSTKVPMECEEIIDRIVSAVNSLKDESPRAKTLFFESIGFFDGNPKSAGALAEKYKVSRAAITQSLRKTREKLREKQRISELLKLYEKSA